MTSTSEEFVTTASYHDIVDQAPSLARTVDVATTSSEAVELTADRSWLFIGCGASFHAGTSAAALLTSLCGVPSVAVPASDVWMNPDVWVRPGTTVVGLSRTGTTTETVAALRTAKAVGATTVGITLTAGTELAKEPDVAVVLDHVGEQGRVMTRSFANLLLGAQALGLGSAQRAGAIDPDAVDRYRHALPAVPDAIASAMDSFDTVARRRAESANAHVVFLGSGPDIGLCRQGALQTQETARPAVEAHHVLDYRHGPMAALTDDTLVVVLTGERSVAADLVLADDVAMLGGTMLAVGPTEVVRRFPSYVEQIATPGGLPDWLVGNVSLPFLQLLAYHLTLARHADPESVRNLDRAKTPHVNPHVLPDGMFERS